MTYFPKLPAYLAGLAALTLGGTATAQDIAALSAVDVLKLQLAAGQTGEQLEEQLSDKLVFDAEDQFENRRKIKTYVETLVASAPGVGGTYSATLPVREITYDFDLRTYKICLPSSVLTKTPVEGGTVESLVSFTFDGLAEKNADLCPFFKNGFKPGGAMGVANYMEIELEMASAEKLHNAIADENSVASFSCDQLTFVQGRFDTGPTQLRCTTAKVEISTEGGGLLSYTAGDGDNWITRSSGAGVENSLAEGDTGMAMGQEESDNTAVAAAAAAAATAALAATAEPETPSAPPMTEGTILTETALELDKAGRISVQRRLNLLGYNTRGVDGVFGPGTRAGVTQWQYKNGLPSTGYLAADQLAVLNDMSENLYVNWLAANANSSTTKKTTTKKKRRFYRGRDGCLRRKPGNARRTIIPGQSRYCNRRRLGKN